MIRSRLSFARLYLKIVTLLLPACAYFIAGQGAVWVLICYLPHSSGWSAFLLEHSAPHHVVAIAAEESGLWNVEQLYAPGGKSRRLLEALAFTYAVVMAGGLIYRQASYSRLVVGISAVTLFILATIARVIFRVI